MNPSAFLVILYSVLSPYCPFEVDQITCQLLSLFLPTDPEHALLGDLLGLELLGVELLQFTRYGVALGVSAFLVFWGY